MGDFDSYSGSVNCENIVRFPVVKDDTDSAIAIKYAVENGYKRVIIYGAIGGNLDHTVANIAHLANYTEKGIDISFIDGDNVIFALHNSKIAFSNEAKGRISVFAYGRSAYGVCERGLFYGLDNAELSPYVPLGVSNEFTGKESEISVSDGTLLIYTSRENFEKHLTK
jgi:thiamine pyrophosphokinase